MAEVSECPPHSWDNYRDCKRCGIHEHVYDELTQAQARIRELEEANAGYKRELARYVAYSESDLLHECNEARERIRELERMFMVHVRDMMADLYPVMDDPAVKALFYEHEQRPIGECDRCGARAPLEDVGVPHGAEKRACAWGCSEARRAAGKGGTT